jgi:hypothetical protein
MDSGKGEAEAEAEAEEKNKAVKAAYSHSADRTIILQNDLPPCLTILT